MSYSFYGGRPGAGINIVGEFATKTERAAKVNYGDYCILANLDAEKEEDKIVPALYKRVLAASNEDEWEEISKMVVAFGDAKVTVNNAYDLQFIEHTSTEWHSDWHN